jgi:hypothetical protein
MGVLLLDGGRCCEGGHLGSARLGNLFLSSSGVYAVFMQRR